MHPTWVWLILLLPPLAGALIGWRLTRDRWWAVIGLSGGLAAQVWFLTLLLAPLRAWQSVRLGPLVAVWFGQPLYPDRTEGMLTSWIYGPVSAVWYGPAALMPNPQTALWLGVVLAIATSFLVLAASARSAHGSVSAGQWVTLALLFIAAVAASPAMFEASYQIASDAPALLLSTLSVLLSRKALLSGRAATAAIAGALIAVAAWTKQPFVFAAVVPVVAMLRTKSRLAVAYLGSALLAGLGLGAVFSGIFGAGNMLDAMFVVPAQHPWEELTTREPRTLGWAIRSLTEHVGPALVIWLVTQWGSRPVPLRVTQTSNWLAWTALAMLPAMLISAAKQGGGQNSFGVVGLLLLASAGVRLVDASVTQRFRAGVVAAIVAGAWMVAGVGPAEAHYRVHNALNSPVARAYQFAAKRPGQVYSPWLPVVTVFTDRRTYHVEWGIIDYVMADRALTPEHQRAGLPPRVRWIIYPKPSQFELAAEYLPAGVVARELPELEGFRVYDLADVKRDEARPPE